LLGVVQKFVKLKAKKTMQAKIKPISFSKIKTAVNKRTSENSKNFPLNFVVLINAAAKKTPNRVSERI
jgi:hypothetical protein